MEVVCFKIFITIFFQNLFSHSRSRIFTRIEWWYSQAPNRSREEDTDDFRFPGFDAWGSPVWVSWNNSDKLSRSRFFTRIEWWYSQAPNRPREEDTDDFRFLTFRSGKTPALSRLTSDFPDFRNLSISRQPLSNINKHLVFPSKPFAPPIVIWLPAWFCVRYVSHSWQKPSVIFLQWRLRHLCFVWCISENCSHHCHINISFHVYSLQLSSPPRWHIDNPSRTHVLPPKKPNQLLLRVWYPCAVWRASASFWFGLILNTVWHRAWYTYWMLVPGGLRVIPKYSDESIA